MGTNENSKNIYISHDITSEERIRLERKRKRENEKEKIRENEQVHLLENLRGVNKSEKNKRVENSEQPQQGAEELSGQQLSKFEDEKQLDKKETCMVGIWKEEMIEAVTEEMQ